MKHLARIGVLVVLVPLSAFLGAAGSADGLNTPDLKTSVTALRGGKEFAPKDARGAFLAVHLVPTAQGTDEANAKFVNDFAGNAAHLAGFREIFVVTDAAPWVSGLGDNAALVYVDSGGMLANELGLAAARAAATVVFDPSGKELFRWNGKGEQDRLSFSGFEQRFNKASADAAIKEYNLPSGSNLAIDGYDPVSYFSGGKPAKGNASITSTWHGVKYQFATKENRDLFNAKPDEYAPTYGGWCATAMGAKGAKVEVDPTNYKIKDGRLHLFYKDFFSNALSDWNKHEKEWEPAADANWKKTSGEDARKPAK